MADERKKPGRPKASDTKHVRNEKRGAVSADELRKAMDATPEGAGFRAYMRDTGKNEEVVAKDIAAMSSAIDLLPDEMDGTMMRVFLSGVLDAFSIEGIERIDLLMDVIAKTDGVEMRSARMTMGPEDFTDEQIAEWLAENPDVQPTPGCDCDRCAALRKHGRGAPRH